MRNTLFKCLIALLLMTAFAATLLTACTPDPAAAVSEGCVRIHIRANSDDRIDQDVKLYVRDGVTAYLERTLADCRTKHDAMRTISAHTADIKGIADRILYNNGYTYASRVTLKKEAFPEKDYGGYTFPRGVYDALIIELGSGRGANWWCVAFPPLCFIPDGGSGEQVMYKSWVKELLDKLFLNT